MKSIQDDVKNSIHILKEVDQSLTVPPCRGPVRSISGVASSPSKVWRGPSFFLEQLHEHVFRRLLISQTYLVIKLSCKQSCNNGRTQSRSFQGNSQHYIAATLLLRLLLTHPINRSLACTSCSQLESCTTSARTWTANSRYQTSGRSRSTCTRFRPKERTSTRRSSGSSLDV